MQKPKTVSSNKEGDSSYNVSAGDYERVVDHHENIETKSTGFEIDRPEASKENEHGRSQRDLYEKVGFGNSEANGTEPYMTTYAMDSSATTGGSGSIESTPRITEYISQDTEPIWDYVPESKEMDVQQVTTRF